MTQWHRQGNFSRINPENDLPAYVQFSCTSVETNPIITALTLVISENRQIRLVISAPNPYVKAVLFADLGTHYQTRELGDCFFYINISEFSSRAYERLLQRIVESTTAYAREQALPTERLKEQFAFAKNVVRQAQILLQLRLATPLVPLILRQNPNPSGILLRNPETFATERPARQRQTVAATELLALFGFLVPPGPSAATRSAQQNRSSTRNNPEASASSTPPIGKNAERLETLHYEGEIPEDYCCALSTQIMTDPVYDERCPQYVFERAWIEAALEKKQENPFTRQALYKNDLRPKKELKEAITQWMQTIETQRNRSEAGTSYQA